jgi:hypothetical protein
MLGDAKKVLQWVTTATADQMLRIRRPEVAGRFAALISEVHDPNYHLRIVRQRALIYIEIPKAACSTIKAMLAEAVKGAPLASQERPERFLASIRGMGVERFFQLIDSPASRGFTVVRNPYTRLISCYNEKYRYPIGLRNRYNRHARQFFGKKKIGGLDQDRPLPFNWFAEMAAAQADTTQDGHLMPMSRIVPRTVIPCNHVGRFEALGAELAQLASELGLPPSRVPHRNPTQRVDASQYLPAPLRETVYRAYRPDFDRFGYPAALPVQG